LAVGQRLVREDWAVIQKPVFELKFWGKAVSLFFLAALLVIHTMDMLLTEHFVGNDWDNETFPPMRLCIKYLGIHPSLWVSRVIVYSLVFLYILNWRRKAWFAFLVTATLLYWSAMTSWLFTLDILDWGEMF